MTTRNTRNSAARSESGDQSAAASSSTTTGRNTPASGKERGQDINREVDLEQKRIQLLELRTRRAQMEVDLRALEASIGQKAAEQPDSAPRANELPKLREPPLFEGKNRASYDNWVRSLERHFRMIPAFAGREGHKVDFASAYMGKLQQDHWERHVAQLAEEGPTWAIMKQVMLDSMGSEAERQQRAHDRLRVVSQGTRSPTELLEEMKVHWQEVREDREEHQIRAFYSALNTNLKLRLLSQSASPATLKEAEDRANMAYRLQSQAQEERKGQKSQPGRKRRGTATTPSPPPTKETGRRSTSRPEGASKAQETTRRPLVCYGCQKTGHKKNDCPGKHLWEDQLGKGQASTPNQHAS